LPEAGRLDALEQKAFERDGMNDDKDRLGSAEAPLAFPRLSHPQACAAGY
jgi:hypothetical protein